MCLSSVEKNYFWPRNIGVGVGYKVFWKFNNNGKEQVSNIAFGSNVYDLNKWYKCGLKARWQRIYGDSISAAITKYYPGFHILYTEQDAENFYDKFWLTYQPSVYQVEYKGLMGYGTQTGYDVKIAKWMKIIKYIGPAKYDSVGRTW